MEFVTQEAFEANLANQTSMTPETLKQLRIYGVTPERRLKLEFFFYTNEAVKGEALAGELQAKEYSAHHGPSASDASLIVVTGWTAPMPMSTNVVLAWTEDMCRIGFKHDCEFDGWGTNPAQPAA